MNKIRYIGLAILAIGVIIQFTVENEGFDFISGLVIGVGIGLLLTGKIGKPALNETINLKNFALSRTLPLLKNLTFKQRSQNI